MELTAEFLFITRTQILCRAVRRSVKSMNSLTYHLTYVLFRFESQSGVCHAFSVQLQNCFIDFI